MLTDSLYLLTYLLTYLGNVCGLSNDVPSDYYCDLDGDGRRRDRFQRPELCLGTVEFIAAAEYMVRPPQAPLFFFVIDTSYQAVASGMLRCVSKALHTHTHTHTCMRMRTDGRPCRCASKALADT